MKTSKPGSKHNRPGFSPLVGINGGISPSSPPITYQLSGEEWDKYRNEPFKPPTDQNGMPLKPPHKPQRPRGGPGGAA